MAEPPITSGGANPRENMLLSAHRQEWFSDTTRRYRHRVDGPALVYPWEDGNDMVWLVDHEILRRVYGNRSGPQIHEYDDA